MKFSALYRKGIDQWPEEVNIGDGYPTGKRGYLFPTLTTIHDEIEEELDSTDDWGQIIVWSFFQAFHAKSKELLNENKNILQTRSVDRKEIERRVLKNLNGEGWEELLAAYSNDL